MESSDDHPVHASLSRRVVQSATSGDRDALREIYEVTSDRVFRLMVRMVGQQDADDLTQQTFVRAFTKLDQFSGESKFETWLYRLATNEALQHLRREKHRRTKELVVTEFKVRSDETAQLLRHFRRSVHVRHGWHTHFVMRHRQRKLSLHLVDVLSSQRKQPIGLTHRTHFATFGNVIAKKHRDLEPLRSHVGIDQVRRHRFDGFSESVVTAANLREVRRFDLFLDRFVLLNRVSSYSIFPTIRTSAVTYCRRTGLTCTFIKLLISGLIDTVRTPPADSLTGTRSIPQIGQLPGPSRRICGCMLHVQIVGLLCESPELDTAEVAGTFDFSDPPPNHKATAHVPC